VVVRKTRFTSKGAFVPIGVPIETHPENYFAAFARGPFELGAQG